MTGHERKIQTMERHIRETEALRDSIPDRIRALLPEGASIEGDDVKKVIALLTAKMDEDLAATRQELDELRRKSN